MGGIGPSADHGKPLLEAGNVRHIGLKVLHPNRHGRIAKACVGIGECFGEAEDKPAMAFMAGLAKVRQASKIPQTADFPFAAYLRPDIGILRHPSQDPFIKCMRVLP